GSLWIGFYLGGVVRRRDGRFEAFGEEQGLPASLVRDLHIDSRGRLWIATAQGGLARCDDPTAERPRFRRYTVHDGLSSDVVSCITDDRRGRIYVGTSRGLDRLDPETGAVRHFSRDDGLPNSFVNVVRRDRHGMLWLGTLEGLALLDPEGDRLG